MVKKSCLFFDHFSSSALEIQDILNFDSLEACISAKKPCLGG